jgi:hypothetical protein
VLPPFIRFGPHDRSDTDSDAIKHLEAEEEEEKHFIQMLIHLQTTMAVVAPEVSTRTLQTH